MSKTAYLLETYTGGGIDAVKQFEGTRREARAKCRLIDNKDGKRKFGQTTCIRFVRYLEAA